MSRIFRDKNKDLINLEVVSSDKVWKKIGKKYYLDKKNYDIFGKIDKGVSTFVTSCNKDGSNSKFVEDTTLLPKKIKKEIVDFLVNKNKKVIYLVKRKKNKPNKGEGGD